MSHHGTNKPEFNKQLHDAMQRALGEYPDGKLNADDEGGIVTLISNSPGLVKLEFPKPVVWLAMTPDEAIGLAQEIIKNARQAAKGVGHIITLAL